MLMLAIILATICSFGFYGVVGSEKALVLAPAMSVALVASVFALGARAWSAARGELYGSAAKSAPSTWGWALFLAWGIAMTFGAVSPFDAWTRVAFITAVVGAYLVSGTTLTAFKDNRLVLAMLIFVVTMTALYGLVAHFKAPDSVLWTTRYTDHYDGRLASTYICPNHFAHLMQMLMPFCVALLFIPTSGVFIKISSVYAFAVFLPTLFLTESRAGWLGAIAGVGVVSCLLALRKSKKLFAALVVLVPLCSALLLVGAWRYSETFQRRMAPVVEFLEGQASGGIGSDSPDFRPRTWLDTIDMIKAAPMLGTGPGSYRYAFPEYRKRFEGRKIVTGHPHNEYLEISADFGLIGFALFAAAWLWGAVWVLIKSLKAEETRHAFIGFAFLGTVAGTMVHSFFDFQLHVFPNAMMFATLAGIAVGPLRRSKKEKRARIARDWKTILATATLFVGFLVVSFFGVKHMGSWLARAYGDKAAEVGKIVRAESWYGFALKLDRSNWMARKGWAELIKNERRLTLERPEKLALAEREIALWESVVEFNAKDPESVSSLGLCQSFLGRTPEVDDEAMVDRGLEWLRVACDLRKFNEHYWWLLGVELRKAGRYQEALETFERMETIKWDASSRKNIQWLKRALNGEFDQVATESPEFTIDTKALIEELGGEPSSEGGDLDRLFDLME